MQEANRVKLRWRIVVVVALVWAGVAALPARADEVVPPPHRGYGMMLAFPPGHVGRVRDAGFDWFKFYVYWNDLEPGRDGVYNWESVDWRLTEACAHGLHLLLRVERDPNDWTPIRDHEMDGWQAMFAGLAGHIAQQRAACATDYVVALEIWNEPNLDFQWGYEPVDPARYTEMVKRAYLGVQAGDPTIPVVAGGLAPTGGMADGRAMNDVAYLEAMYAHGLAGHFDVMGVHTYGFGGEPEDKEHGSGILNFRRAEDIYAVMVAHGDGDKPVWNTEFGWLLDAAEEGHPECVSYWDSIGFAWQRVSAAQQADYLERAFAYADANWPWMGVMFVSNLDFSTMPWYTTCEPMRWFAILHSDGSPRPAYTALQTMDKRPRPWGTAEMRLEPASLAWAVRLRERARITETVTVVGTGDPFAWSAVTGTLGLPFTITPTSGLAGEAFQVQVDARALVTGTYTGAITVTAADALVMPREIILPLTLDVWGAWGMDARPASLHWMMAVDAIRPVWRTVAVDNTGDFEFEWAVTHASESLTITVIPPDSDPTGTLTILPGTFQAHVDARGLPVGTHTGTLTITASAAQVPESPFVLPVSVRIVEQLYSVYLPLVTRGY